MSDLTKEQRDKLREQANKATPGPWTQDPDLQRPDIEVNQGRQGGQIGIGGKSIHDVWCRDANYIAAANPQAVLSLLDALDAADNFPLQAVLSEWNQLQELLKDVPGDFLVQKVEGLKKAIKAAGEAADRFCGDGLQVYSMKSNNKPQKTVLMCDIEHWLEFTFALCHLKGAVKQDAASGNLGHDKEGK